MKQFFINLWEKIKKIFHIGKKVVAEEAEQAKNELVDSLRDELATIEAELTEATGEAIEILTARAKTAYSKLLAELRHNLKD